MHNFFKLWHKNPIKDIIIAKRGGDLFYFKKILYKNIALFISKFKLRNLLLCFISAIIISFAIFKFDPLLFNSKKANLLFDWTGSNWSKFTPDDRSFSAYFPQNPMSISKEIPLPTPSHSEFLPYQEYSYTDDKGKYEVSFTTLPSSWMKWSSKLILSGALKLVMGKSNIIEKHSTTSHTFPAIKYEAKSFDGDIIGKLILVREKLYRVEVLYKEKETKEQAILFIDSFIPTPDF
jgi:hypothetical protein